MMPDGLPVNLNTNGHFSDTNANKRSITINTKTERGNDLTRRLGTISDIVIENFAYGVPERRRTHGNAHGCHCGQGRYSCVFNEAGVAINGEHMFVVGSHEMMPSTDNYIDETGKYVPKVWGKPRMTLLRGKILLNYGLLEQTSGSGKFIRAQHLLGHVGFNDSRMHRVAPDTLWAAVNRCGVGEQSHQR